MAINPLNHHYSMENPASVYDEEALTALELAGRITAKVNEAVEVVNKTVADTKRTLKEQTETQIPNTVDQAIKKQVDDGTFTDAINAFAGDLRSDVAQKMDANKAGVVGMTQLSQEVKQSMTGGSVAVVGVDSVGVFNIQNNAVHPVKTTFAREYRNYFDTTQLSMGYWAPADHPNAGEYWPDGNSTYVLAPFDVFPGVGYVIKDVRHMFSYLGYTDGTKVYLNPTIDVTGDAYVIPEKPGKLYLTFNNPATHANWDGSTYAVTNYKSFVTPGKKTPGVGFTYVPDLVTSFGMIKKLGIAGNFAGVGFNGGVVNGNTVTIPAGSTGYSTYGAYQWNNPQLKNKTGWLALNFKIRCSGENPFDYFTIGANAADETGRDYLRHPDMIHIEKDGSYTYIGAFDCEGEAIQIYLMQLSRNVTFTHQVDITFNGGYLLCDNLQAFPVEGSNTVITVKKTGGDFNNLRDAFEYADTLGNTVIELYPGEYDVMTYYTDAEKTATGFKGLFIPDTCTLRGVGNREDIIIKAELSTGNVNISTLNLRNTASMENVTVVGNNTRYTVHDDFAGVQTEYTRRVKNCVFIGRNLYYKSVYGTGTKQGAKWYFENCEFINETGGNAFSNHNNVGFNRECYLEFDNCVFKTSADVAVRLGSLNTGANGMLTYVTFRGCHFDGPGTTLWLMEENKNLYGAGILFKVSGYANNGVSAHTQSTDGKDYSGNIRLI